MGEGTTVVIRTSSGVGDTGARPLLDRSGAERVVLQPVRETLGVTWEVEG